MAPISARQYVERQFAVEESRIKRWTRMGDRAKPKRLLFDSLASFINDFLEGINRQNVVIIPGLRGIGKTTLLFQLYESFKDDFGSGHSIYLTCDDVRTKGLGLAEVLEGYETFFLQTSLERLGSEDKVLVLIDEIHYQDNWATIIKSFADRSQNVLFILTGSSALSLEITTDLARRKAQYNMFPLTFVEYCTLGGELDQEESLQVPKKESEKIAQACFGALSLEQRLKLLGENLAALRTSYFSKLSPLEVKLEDFLVRGGLPNYLAEERDIMYEELLDVCDRVTKEDLPLVSNIGKSGKVAQNGIISLGLIADDPTFSLRRMADSIGNISRESVSNLLKGYGKSGLIDLFKPYGSTKTITRKSHKYYLASPTLQAALWWNVGRFERSEENIGKLWETYIANRLSQMVKSQPEVSEVFYDYQEGGADFIVKLKNEDLMAVETGWGRKGVRQVVNTLKRINGTYGLVISEAGEDYQKVEVGDREIDVVFVPKEAVAIL